jgi:hypothetical protein
MNRRWTTALMALVLALVSVLGAAGSASAQGQSKLPQIKNPQSARFDITGRLVVAGETLTISGGGSLSGTNFEESITYTVPPSMAQPGAPTSITTRIMLVDGKMYIEIPDTMGTGQAKWYVVDVPMTAGQPGMATSNPQLEEALTVTQEGAEDVHGAATTRYRIDVDVAKMQAAMGQTGASLQAATMTMYMWVGNADQYLHRFSMNMVIALPSEVQGLNLTLDMQMDFRDFDQPVTITAPAGAEPLNMPGLGTSPMPVAPGAGMAGDLLGAPLGIFLNAGVSGPPVGMPPTVEGVPAAPVGMPRTGAGGDILPGVLLALAFASAIGGAVLRRSASLRG